MEFSNCFSPFRFFEWVSGPFWAKNGCLWDAQLWEGTCPVCHRPKAEPLSFGPKTWIWQGHHGSRMARVE